MAVAMVALTVALGGTSYAAVAITGSDVENGSLTGRDIDNGSLTGADVRNNSLRGADVQGIRGGDIRNGSLNARDFKEGQLPRTRWALVREDGQIEAQSGGFTVVSAYQANPPGAAGNVYIDTGDDLTDNGIGATIALQNAADQNGDGLTNGRAPGADANPEFSGEITASRCAIGGQVTCAPPGANVPNVLVVSPRNSDGTLPPAGARKRFYVTVTG
jgi:hypothetical protein